MRVNEEAVAGAGGANAQTGGVAATTASLSLWPRCGQHFFRRVLPRVAPSTPAVIHHVSSYLRLQFH